MPLGRVGDGSGVGSFADSENTGHPKLREHLGATVMAMKLSKEWDAFYTTMNTLLPPYPPVEERSGQRTIQFPVPKET